LDLNLSENARTVLEKRYLVKKDGKPIETPEQLFQRVANNIAEADKLYDKKADIKGKADCFYELMTSLKFMPNSPTLMVRQDS
jgi:ribonucleoside-diphosphate reductase alpha chain